MINFSLIKKLIHTRQRTNYFYQLSNNEILPGGDPKFVDLVKDIVALSQAMQLDFAAIDVVRSNDNKYYIIDVNITPNWNGTDQSKKMAFLAAGLV